MVGVGKVEKTVVHMGDEVEEHDGDWSCGCTYLIPKKFGSGDMRDMFDEYTLVRQRYMALDEGGDRVAKHVYFTKRL